MRRTVADQIEEQVELTPRTSEEVTSESTEVAARVDNVSFRYGTEVRLVLKEVSLTLRAGEIVSIVGPSGCGKSTLLRIIAGLLPPLKGSVQISKPADVKTDRPSCSMVFQEDTLLPWLRLETNVRLAFKFRGVKTKESENRVNRLIEMAGLTDAVRAYPYELSGGMRRRAAVVGAVAPLPRLLLLDEPFSALDEPTRIQLHGDLYRLFREFHITTLLVTHDIGEAISLSDRILVLSRAPARVVWECSTDLGVERDMSTLRTKDRFLELYGDLWRELNGA